MSLFSDGSGGLRWDGSSLLDGSSQDCIDLCCGPIGACCRTNGTCFQSTLADCIAANGTAWQEGVSCADAHCVPRPTCCSGQPARCFFLDWVDQGGTGPSNWTVNTTSSWTIEWAAFCGEGYWATVSRSLSINQTTAGSRFGTQCPNATISHSPIHSAATGTIVGGDYTPTPCAVAGTTATITNLATLNMQTGIITLTCTANVGGVGGHTEVMMVDTCSGFTVTPAATYFDVPAPGPPPAPFGGFRLKTTFHSASVFFSPIGNCSTIPASLLDAP